ncbi:early endosome antigen 1 [Anaeramoeba ignava]|uniref:Early endosome antigen 1 n=1 Tax=Anaeramoeba ignava TaxID=1746090 RepID=A0A9Q0RBM9_ANAIG|nr:early endosome antigen 1 [Anaeramoeba ignava]
MNQKEEKDQFLFDLPIIPLHLNKPLAKTHETIKFTPGGFEKYKYSIVLPKQWQVDSEVKEVNKHFPRWWIIGLFAPVMEPSAPFVSVTMCKFKFEINLEDWMEYFCKADNWQIFATRWWKVPSKGIVIDCGAYKIRDSETDVMRAMAFSNNKRIFMICGVARSPVWDQFKNHFLVACATFTLSKPKTNSFEKFDIFEGCNPFIGISFPSSWKLQEQTDTPKGKSAIELQLVDSNDTLAYLLIKASSILDFDPKLKPLDILIEQALQELEQSGFEFTANKVFIQGKEFKHSSALTGWVNGKPHLDSLSQTIKGYYGTAIIPGKVGDNIVESRLGFRVLDSTAFSIYLISVSKKSDFILWMRSKRAFEITREFLWNDELNRNANIFKELHLGDELNHLKLQGGLQEIGWKMKTQINIITNKDPRKLAYNKLEKPIWLVDKESSVCMNCKAPFTVTLRRHHCRNCGLIFCSKCSTERRAIPKYGFFDPVRVCDNCAKLLGNESSTNSENIKKAKKLQRTQFPIERHSWGFWKPGSYVKTQTWKNTDATTSRYITYTLQSVNVNKYSLQIQQTTHSNKEPLNKTVTLRYDQDDDMMLYSPSTPKVQYGVQLISIENEWFECTVWKTISEGLDSIERSQWVAEKISFPIKTVVRNEPTQSYSERVVIKLNDEIRVSKKSVKCIKYQGFTINDDSERTTHLVWMSEDVPGDLVKMYTQFPNGESSTTEVVDFKATPRKIK